MFFRIIWQTCHERIILQTFSASSGWSCAQHPTAQPGKKIDYKLKLRYLQILLYWWDMWFKFWQKVTFLDKKHASVQKLIFIQKVNVGTLKRLPTSLVCAFLFLWVIRQSEQRNYWDASLHLDSRIPDSWMKSLLSTEMCLQQVRMEESRTVHVGERLCGERKRERLWGEREGGGGGAKLVLLTRVSCSLLSAHQSGR